MRSLRSSNGIPDSTDIRPRTSLRAAAAPSRRFRSSWLSARPRRRATHPVRGRARPRIRNIAGPHAGRAAAGRSPPRPRNRPPSVSRHGPTTPPIRSNPAHAQHSRVRMTHNRPGRPERPRSRVAHNHRGHPGRSPRIRVARSRSGRLERCHRTRMGRNNPGRPVRSRRIPVACCQHRVTRRLRPGARGGTSRRVPRRGRIRRGRTRLDHCRMRMSRGSSRRRAAPRGCTNRRGR